MATLFMISGIGKIMMVSIFTKSGYPGCRVIGSTNPSRKRGKSFLNFKVRFEPTTPRFKACVLPTELCRYSL